MKAFLALASIAIALALGFIYVITNPPTIDFVSVCYYDDGYAVNVHRGVCIPRDEKLTSWKVFFQKAEWESTWDAYLAPYSAGSPYYAWDYGNDSHLEHLLKEAVYYIAH